MCPEHTAPFQALADAFFHRVRKAIWIGTRSSGKTRGASILHFANAVFKPRCATLHASTIEPQAHRCRRYVDEYHRLPIFRPLGPSAPARLRAYPNGATLEVVPGTVHQMSSPKAQVVFLDEVEFLPWDVLQQSLGVAHSQPDIPSLMLFASTRQRVFGSMNRLSQHAERMGLAVYNSCVWETMAPCRRRSPTCPLWERCEGGRWCQNDEGFLDPEDIIAKAGMADQETWDTQYVARRPSRRGLVFDTFDPAIHVRAARAEYVPGIPVVLGADWGYSHPAAVLFGQRLGEVLSIFDEVYVQRKLNAELLDLVRQKLQHYGVTQVAAGWADPEDPEANAIFRAGLPCRWSIVTTPTTLEDRLRAVRERLRNALGEVRLFVHPRCVNTIAEFSLYHHREVGTGTDGEPLYADAPEPENDHAMDALGYLCWGLRSAGRPSMSDLLRLTEGVPPRGRPQWPMDRPVRVREAEF